MPAGLSQLSSTWPSQSLSLPSQTSSAAAGVGTPATSQRGDSVLSLWHFQTPVFLHSPTPLSWQARPSLACSSAPPSQSLSRASHQVSSPSTWLGANSCTVAG